MARDPATPAGAVVMAPAPARRDAARGRRAGALLFLLAGLGGCHQPPPPAPPAPGCERDSAERLADVINTARADEAMSALHMDRRLMAAAESHSVDMARTGHLSHTGSDGSTFGQRIAAAGYRLTSGGEVVATGYPSAVTVVANWLRSTRHRDVVLAGDAVHIGTACAQGARGLPFWTAVVAAERP